MFMLSHPPRFLRTQAAQCIVWLILFGALLLLVWWFR